jgi:DNA repair exonuclease SbcCD nuclease subunit
MNIFSKDTVAIFSDLHLGVGKDSKFWHDISYEWAQWFIEDLHKKNIKDIVFCGDFHHSRSEVSVNTLNFGHKILKLFSDFNVHMIVGNHDCYLKDSAEINSISQYNEWKNITVYSKPCNVDHNGKTINFIPWGTKLADIPNADYTFGHFEINLFKMNTYALCEDGFTAEELLEKTKTVISGHFHLRDQRNYSDGTILYVGNPFEMDFNDAGTSKGYYILDINTGEFEFTKNEISPKHVNLTLSYLVSEKNLTSE